MSRGGLDLCDVSHDPIVHAEHECPLCEANGKLEDVEDLVEFKENHGDLFEQVNDDPDFFSDCCTNKHLVSSVLENVDLYKMVVRREHDVDEFLEHGRPETVEDALQLLRDLIRKEVTREIAIRTVTAPPPTGDAASHG